MLEPQIPQDRIPIQPDGQRITSQNEFARKIHDISDFRWPRIIGIVALVLILMIVGWVLISDGGKFMSGIFANLTSWVDQSTIDPHDTKGFTSFIRLTLTAALIALVLYFLGKK